MDWIYIKADNYDGYKILAYCGLGYRNNCIRASLVVELNTPQQKPNRIIVYVAMFSMLCALFNRIVVDSNASEIIKDIADYSVFGALALLMAVVFYRAYKNIKSGNGKR